MTERKSDAGRPYDTYDRYPVSSGNGRGVYGQGASQTREPATPDDVDAPEADDWSGLVGDPTPAACAEGPRHGADPAGGLKPLRLLQSLFSDRLDLLRAALSELEAAEQDRARLTTESLQDIDARIAECEDTLRVLRGERVLNDIERRKHLERQLLELKRQRRQEAVLSWRDLLALRREIRTLQREVRSLTGTVPGGDAGDSPRGKP